MNIQIRQRILHRNDTYALFSASSLVIAVLSYTTIPFIHGFKQVESFCIAVMATSPLLLNKMVSYDHPILFKKIIISTNKKCQISEYGWFFKSTMSLFNTEYKGANYTAISYLFIHNRLCGIL